MVCFCNFFNREVVKVGMMEFGLCQCWKNGKNWKIKNASYSKATENVDLVLSPAHIMTCYVQTFSGRFGFFGKNFCKVACFSINSSSWPCPCWLKLLLKIGPGWVGPGRVVTRLCRAGLVCVGPYKLQFVRFAYNGAMDIWTVGSLSQQGRQNDALWSSLGFVCQCPFRLLSSLFLFS